MRTAVRQKAIAWLLAWLLMMLCPAGLAADIVTVDVQPDRAPATAQIHPSPTGQGHAQTPEPSPKAAYLVQYIDHDDTILAEVYIAEEDRLTVPSITPKRPGFIFLYWYDESTTGGPSIPYVFGAQPAGNLRLHALYAEIPQKVEHPAPLPPEASMSSTGGMQPNADQRME